MIDTHTHLYFSEFDEELTVLIEKCQSAGVKHLILPNVDKDSFPQMVAMHQKFPNYTSKAIGLHPTEVKENWEEFVDQFETELKSGTYVAIGEIGIDLYWDKSYLQFQKDAFERQIKLGEKFNLPLIIHCREALNETLEIIAKVKPKVPLVFHSFTGKKEDVERIREICDPWFGINGVVTYKNAQELREALNEIGLPKILLETDSPYLTPVPFRGHVNNSSYLVHIRDKIADCLGICPEIVDEITDQNARLVFKI